MPAEVLNPTQSYREIYTDFHSLCTKHAPNLIQKNQARVMVNLEAYRHDIRRRQAIGKYIGPPSEPRLMLSHEDLQARKWLLAHCENGEIYFTRNIETAVGSDWIKCQISGQGDLGLNTNYLPSGCSFNGHAYFVNGFNGTVKFSGDQYVTVPAVPTCRIIAPGARHLMAIGLIDNPEYMRMSALDDGDIWSGTEVANSIYSKTQSDMLPDIQQYLFKVGLSGDHVVGYAKKGKTHIFFGTRGVYAAWGGLDPLGFTREKEAFVPFRLTSAIGCLNGRSIAETPDGLLIWQGSDGQLYVWNGEVSGAAGSEQFNVTIFCLTEPKDPDKPDISNLMDFNNGGYAKPEYDLAAIGADSQAEWVAGTTKTNVDTATKPGTLLASRDATGVAVKEYHTPTIDHYEEYTNWSTMFGGRFKCTETGVRNRVQFYYGNTSPSSIRLDVNIYEDNGSGKPDETKYIGWGFVHVATGSGQLITCDFTIQPYLTLGNYYHFIVLGEWVYPYWAGIGMQGTGTYSDGYVVTKSGGVWIAPYGNYDLWFKLYGGALVYQASSVWHHYYDKGDITSSWGLFLEDHLLPPNTTLTFYAKCAATAAEVDTAAEITAVITNGTSLDSATYGGNNPVNRFVGLKIVATTTTPFDKTWEVYRIKASFVKGSVASALGQAAVYNRVYHLSLMEQTLLTPWNPGGDAASVNNAILTVDRDLGFRILQGFKADETKQTDFAFNALVNHDGKLYGALANPISIGGANYTTGAGKATSGGSGSGCTVNISTVVSGKITVIASAPTAGGTGYAVGDYLLITTGGTGGYVRVTAVNVGVVTALSLTSNYICKFDVDQEYDLLDDADHKILAWWEGRLEDFGFPNLPKIFDEERITREELGSNYPFQMEYAMNGSSTFYLLGFTQKELKAAASGCILTIASAPTAGGTGYAVGDFLAVSEGSYGIVKVTAVTAGVVTEVVLWGGGYGYTTGSGKATFALTGVGVNCTINIQSILSGYDMLYPETNTNGYIGKKFRSVSPSWPKTPTSLRPYYQNRIIYPNKVVLEPAYEAHSTVAYTLQKRLKTTNKIHLQSMETIWRMFTGGYNDGEAYKVEEVLT